MTRRLRLRPANNPTASIIWLHGLLGADGHDFEPIVPELRLAFAARFVFPHAPHRPVTVNNGHVMRAWYDMGMSGNRLVQKSRTYPRVGGYSERVCRA